jgi:hypothetical protein
MSPDNDPGGAARTSECLKVAMSLRRRHLPSANRALDMLPRTPNNEYVHTMTSRHPHSSGRIATFGGLARNFRLEHSPLNPPESERPRT